MLAYLVVAAGGSLGALTRYMIGVQAHRKNIQAYKGTLFINMLGSFMIGIMAGLNHKIDLAEGYTFAVTGFLGGFTTFSTFALQLITLLRERRVKEAALVCAASVLFGIPLAAIGFMAVQALLNF